MTKRDIAVKIANEMKLPQSDVLHVVQKTLDILIEELSSGRNVELRNFGVFEVLTRKQRKGRNPRHPETEVVIPEHTSVKFRPGKVLKARVETLDM